MEGESYKVETERKGEEEETMYGKRDEGGRGGKKRDWREKNGGKTLSSPTHIFSILQITIDPYLIP